jgi:two-component system, LuxR family, sensor kinase FixL
MPTRLTLLGVRIPEGAFQRKRIFALALATLVCLAAAEWYFHLDFSLGIFYTIPVLVAAMALNRSQIIFFGLLCALARAPFTPANSLLEGFLKFLMASIAYCGSGLLVVEMNNNRRRVLEHYARLKFEQDLRMRAEEQLRILAESSPAAIFTLDASSVVQAANRAAHEMLGVEHGELLGKDVSQNFPIFTDALKISNKDRSVRTSVTGWARKKDDQLFPIQTWFSVYGLGDRKFVAAIVVDMSEEVRDRERENFQHLLDYNRLLAGAVSHEIRNLCSAIRVVCSNLNDSSNLRGNADFDALVQLVDALSRMASFKLKHKADDEVPRADLKSVLDQLRLVIEPDWEELEGEVVWQVPEEVPAVTGDAHGLLQIFLNLSQNSLRAVESMAGDRSRRLTISLAVNSSDSVLTFVDTGPGVANPEVLFHPFRPEADGSGLGLYVSRELARSFGGDLLYRALAEGAEFRVLMPLAASASRRTDSVPSQSPDPIVFA